MLAGALSPGMTLRRALETGAERITAQGTSPQSVASAGIQFHDSRLEDSVARLNISLFFQLN